MSTRRTMGPADRQAPMRSLSESSGSPIEGSVDSFLRVRDVAQIRFRQAAISLEG